MTIQCCVCKKVRREERWTRATQKELRDEAVSHGYCPSCAKKAFAEIRATQRRPAAV